MAQSETRCECGHAHEGQDECGAYGCGCEQFRPAAPDTGTDGASLLKRRDDAWDYFVTHPESYHAMCQWEDTDEDLRDRLAELDRLRARPDTGDARLREAVRQAMYEDEEEHTIICRRVRAALADAGTPEETTR